MSDLSDLVHRLMRDVTLLNPMEPGAHFLAMLHAKGLTIVKKVEAEGLQANLPASSGLVMAAQNQMPAAVQSSAAAKLIAEAKAKRTKT